MRLGFFGMENVVSVRVLEALLTAGHDVRFVLKPVGGLIGRRQPLFERAEAARDDFLRRGLDPFVLAAQRGIPAWVVGDAGRPAVAEFVAGEELDLLVICFFNQLVPAAVFGAPAHGAINLHPSLLPRYRGPSPLFWMFKHGDLEGGLTVHQVVAGEDAGPIWAQRRVAVPLGATLDELLDILATRAGTLMQEAVLDVARGARTPTAQGPTPTVRARRPRARDRLVGGPMTAQATYCLARGMGRIHDLRVFGEERLRVVDGLGFTRGEALPADSAEVGDTAYVRCADGRALLRVVDKS